MKRTIISSCVLGLGIWLLILSIGNADYSPAISMYDVLGAVSAMLIAGGGYFINPKFSGRIWGQPRYFKSDADALGDE